MNAMDRLGREREKEIGLLLFRDNFIKERVF